MRCRAASIAAVSGASAPSVGSGAVFTGGGTVSGATFVALAGSQDTINVFGTGDTVDALGSAQVNLFNTGDVVSAGNGADTINVDGAYDSMTCNMLQWYINEEDDSGRLPRKSW